MIYPFRTSEPKKRLHYLRVDGEADLTGDMAGHSSYFVRLEPTDAGVEGAGELALHRRRGDALETRLDSEYTNFDPSPEELPHPFTDTEYRVVTEHGKLDGTTYTSTIHSTLHGADPIAAIDGLESNLE